MGDSGSGLDSSIFVDGGGYHVLPISILLLGGYFITHFLFNKGILSQQKHSHLWNLLVTAEYAGTGITGVLLILMINLGVRTALNLILACRIAILMVVGTLIHVHIYRKPFKNMFKVLFGFKSDSNKGSESCQGPPSD